MSKFMTHVNDVTIPGFIPEDFTTMVYLYLERAFAKIYADLVIIRVVELRVFGECTQDDAGIGEDITIRLEYIGDVEPVHLSNIFDNEIEAPVYNGSRVYVCPYPVSFDSVIGERMV